MEDYTCKLSYDFVDRGWPRRKSPEQRMCLWSVIKVGSLEFPIKSRVLFLRQRKFSWEESLRRPTSKGLLLKDYSNVSEGSINSKGNWGLRNRVNLRWQCKEKYLALDERTAQSLRPINPRLWMRCCPIKSTCYEWEFVPINIFVPWMRGCPKKYESHSQ